MLLPNERRYEMQYADHLQLYNYATLSLSSKTRSNRASLHLYLHTIGIGAQIPISALIHIDVHEKVKDLFDASRFPD